MPYSESPSYQKRMARVMALPPEKQAVLGFAAQQAEAASADEEARRGLALQRMANTRDARDARLGLEQERLAIQGDLQNRRLQLGQESIREDASQNRRAENIGLANLGLSGVVGWGQMKAEEDRAKKLGALAALFG